MKKLIDIDNFKFKDGKQLLKHLKKNKILFSPWIEDILINKLFKKNNKKFCLYIINVRRDINITTSTTLNMIHKKIKLKNLKLIPPEIAIYSASLINMDNKTGKWFRFATPLNSMVDSDKVPHLPKFGYALGRKFIETYWSYPNAVFYPHNDFIVCKEK